MSSWQNAPSSFPQEIALDDLTEFRAGWKHLYPSSTTRAKVQERLRAFLRYCYESQLIDRVPKLSPIKVDEVPHAPALCGSVQEATQGDP